MASATSEKNVVSRGTSVRNRKKSYYVTDVTKLADGSLKRETYRTDDKGNNRVKVQEANTDKDGKLISNEISSTATAAERKDLKNPNSQMRKAISQQTKNAGDKVQQNETEAAAGGLTSIGKKNQEVVAGGSGNTALNEVQTGDNSRPSGQITTDAKTRDSFPQGLRYPVDMASAQDVIKFDMLKYEPKKVSGFGFSERNKDRASIGSVTLPIPGGISDSNACNWGDDTMNPLQIAGAALALGALGSDSVTGGLGGALGDLKNQVVENNQTVKSAIAGATASAAIGSDINSLLGRTQGVIINPNLELLFQSPTLRPFTFEFKMSPRSSDEAARIVEIIRFFKQGMAPIRDESRLFLKTPHTFKIKYIQNGEDSKFLNKFKECALLSCNIQYTPEGNYAPYEDGAMSSYRMSLQFKELEPVYNDEYSDFDDTNIGF